MNRRVFMLMFGAAVGAASMSVAETFADQVVRQLVAQGYGNIQVEATLLGRLRIKGSNGQGLREIILNPKTGEILRDMWLDADGNPILAQLPSSGQGAGGEDSSGSGSGSDDSSGSGSGGDDDAEDAAEDAADDAKDAAEDAADDAEDARDDREDREREND